LVLQKKAPALFDVAAADVQLGVVFAFGYSFDSREILLAVDGAFSGAPACFSAIVAMASF